MDALRFTIPLLLAGILIVVFGFFSPSLAQAPELPAGEAVVNNVVMENGEDANSGSYLEYLIRSLGWFFGPVFLALSIWAVAMIVMNILAIRRSVIAPPPLVEELESLLEEKKYQDAYELARESDTFLGTVLAAGLPKFSGGYESARQAMQDTSEEELMHMEHRLGMMAMLANISPMIGLLGTVVGMVASFQVIALSQQTPQASKLAEGISMALVTTEFGLFIAIPCIMCYDMLKNRLAALMLETGGIIERLIDRFKPQVGKQTATPSIPPLTASSPPPKS